MNVAQLCSCEGVAKGELGPVESGERVARVVLDPRHFTKKGDLKPSLFPQSHVKSGVSLMRADHLNAETMQFHADHIASKMPGEKAAGVVLCLAGTLREDVHPEHGGRSLCVLEDPVAKNDKEPANPAHALTLTSLADDKTELLRLQQFLADTFGALTQVQQVYA